MQGFGNSMKSDKVIVFTGAFLPETFKDSDASFNVGVAVGAVQVLLSVFTRHTIRLVF